MAKTKEDKQPKVQLTKDEVQSLESLEVENEEVIASMDDRNAETKKNELEVEAHRKSLKIKDELDPIKRRELRMGNKKEE